MSPRQIVRYSVYGWETWLLARSEEWKFECCWEECAENNNLGLTERKQKIL